MKKLGGVQFVRNAIELDYCFKESIACLKALCDEVIILDAGSTDGTAEIVRSMEDEKTKVICLPPSEWEKLKGKEMLAHFQNLAKEMLTTEWYFLLQSDEVLHEDSFKYVREAIETDNEGFLCTRINLWGNTQHELNVEPNRLPCGNKIVRLAKRQYFSVGDGEAIFVGNAPSWDFLGKLRIYHLGFCRNKFIHTKKIEHMLMRVFGHNDMDKKVVEMNGVFNPWSNFSKEDVIHISEHLPIFVQKWAKERDEINGFEI